MLLDIEKLTVTFPGASREAPGFRSCLSLRMERGETLGIIGESGSGKSTSMLALMGLLDRAGTVKAERIRVDGPRLPEAGRSPRSRRQEDDDDLPGADDQPEPVLEGG